MPVLGAANSLGVGIGHVGVFQDGTEDVGILERLHVLGGVGEGGIGEGGWGDHGALKMGWQGLKHMLVFQALGAHGGHVVRRIIYEGGCGFGLGYEFSCHLVFGIF